MTSNETLTKTDKFFAVGFVLSLLMTIYGFFGAAPFIWFGVIVLALAVIALLGWVNEKTGGALFFFFLIESL